MNMPRKARIDAPGALHHIIGRGIERRKIFYDDTDRDNFLERLEIILKETSTPCYGWALIPNHFHLLLRTGKAPISTVMRRLLTGYAVSFNRRHRRYGHLFQNRFKSILCQENLYLKQLVGYIHLNPLRARIVANLKELSKYPYGGHSAIMGKRTREFQDVDYVLRLFGDKVVKARRNYREYVQKSAELGRRPELVGGGLLRSSGGWGVLKAMSKARIHLKGDERILGESDFVKEVLAQQKEQFERRYWLKAEGYDIDRVVKKVAEVFDIEPEQICKPGNQPLRVKARSLVCYWAVRELGLSGTSVGKLLGLGQPAVSRAVVRGEKLSHAMNLSLRQ
jgi:REP element-mobilizing transposase RayT